MRIIQTRSRRRGATVVESTFVIGILFLFIFGIFEYARFLFFLEMAENATREGARFASVNTGRTVSVGNNTDVATLRSKSVGTMTKYYMYDDSDAASPPTIKGVVNYFMKGRQNNVTSYNISVYSASVSGTTVNNLGDWQSAQFGGEICVSITGNYQFAAAGLLGFSGTVPITVRSLMNSEAN